MRLIPFRRTRRAARRGFSIIELMTVFVVFALVVMIGVPRFDYMRATTHMRSAKAEITSMLATARATAVRRGRPAELRRNANQMWVTSGGAMIVRPVQFDSLYRVTLASTAPTVVVYDSRGLANLTSGTGVFAFTRETHRDSVCVTRFGAIMKDGCL